MGVQVKIGVDAFWVWARTNSNETAVDVEIVDYLRDEDLCLCEDGRSDASGRVQDEDDVNLKLSNLS